MIESREDIQKRRMWVFMRLGSGTPLMPRLYGVGEKDVALWRRFLKREIAHERRTGCEKCGSKNSLQKHEGIVKQNEISKSVPGWWEIFSEYNCFILCAECHMNEGLPRAEFYEMASRRYSKEIIDGWLESLPFKHTFQPPRE